jgi:hypothetical protein
MAETLQEYLISVRYAVDSASQNRFLSTLKQVAGSVAGVAAEITGLAGAVLELTKHLAETGEQFYWMSQRIGASVADIQTATFAMSQLGVSAGEARASIERFGDWSRNMGPAATGFLRTLGVTARDTAGQLEQLGPVLRAMGGTAAYAQGTDAQRGQYAIARRTAQILGIDERTMLALTSGQYSEEQSLARKMQRAVWGVGTDAQVSQRQDEWAKKSTEVMQQFRQIGLIFDTLQQKFGLSLFEKMLPELRELTDLLIAALPQISQWLDTAATALAGFIHLVNVAIKTFEGLPPAIQHMLEVLVALPGIVALAKSPLAWFIGALTLLLLLIDDYQGWKSGKDSAIDWSGFDSMAKSIAPIVSYLNDMRKGIDCWLEGMTGIKGLFTDILVMAGALTLWKVPGWLASFLATRAAPAAAKAVVGGVTGFLGTTAGAVTAGAAATAGVIAAAHEGYDSAEALRAAAEKRGYTAGQEPGSFDSGAGADFFTDKEGNKLSPAEMRAKLIELDKQDGGAAPKPESSVGGGWAGRFLADRFGGGAGGAGIGLTAEQYDVFRNTLGQRESGNRYDIMGGSSGRFAGKYQMGAAEIAETAGQLGEAVPSQQQFLSDPAMQERFFARYTKAHYEQLMKDPAFAALSPEDRAGTLATAHLLGVGGALRQLHGGWAGRDAFGTSGASYAGMVSSALKPLGSDRAVGTGGGKALTVQNSATINVAAGPTAEATAMRVADAQTRVNEQYVRNAQGSLR